MTGRNGEPFGYNCSASALGSLYYVSLGLHEPDSAVPSYTGPAGPFQNFQAYLYWSKSPAIDPKQGFVSFSFASGFQGANVFRNYLYVLPMFKGKKDGMSQTSDAQWMSDDTGSLLYDPSGNITWLADANLAATKTFGIVGINPDGSMDHDTALKWVAAMNASDGGKGYLGRTDWDLPDTGPPDSTCSMKGITGFACTGSAMGSLFYKQLSLKPRRVGNSFVAIKGRPVCERTALSLLGLLGRFGIFALQTRGASRWIRVEFLARQRLPGNQPGRE
jgi:hypothetical protein